MTKELFRLSCLLLFYSMIAISLFACASRKIEPQEKLARTPDPKDLYYFHSGDSTWIVKPVPSAGNLFTGEIYQPDETTKSRQPHIYAEPLSAVNIEQGNISVPMENIVKVENFRIKPGTIILAAGVVVLLFLIPTVL